MVNKKLTVASYMLFTPVFFASIGINTDLSGITTELVLFSLILFVVAVLSKIIGCGFGAKIFGLSSKESMGVGIGMVARGEVAFLVAQKGIDAGFIDQGVFPAVILVVLLVSLVTPILLKVALKDEASEKVVVATEM